MLWPLTLVTVREEHNDTRVLPPLGAVGGHELVDDGLRNVREVAELRLPQDERIIRSGRVAVFESQDGRLRERRIVDLERGFRRRQMLQRNEFGAGLDVVEDSVPVGERASRGVLSREADAGSLEEQRSERERFGVSPIDAALVTDRGTAPLQWLDELWIWREVGRPCQQTLIDGDERFRLHGRVDLLRLWSPPLIPGLLNSRLGAAALQPRVNRVELPHHLVGQPPGFVFGDDALGN